MRIVIPDYAPPDSFADNVAHTLRQMGHEVLTLRGCPRFRRARWLYQRARRRLSSGYLDFRERWLLRRAREHRPEMVLAVTQCIAEEALRELKRLGVRYRVAWWADPPANLSVFGWGLLSAEWDLICLKDPDGVAKFRRLGLNAHLLHEAMNPSWHRPVASQANGDVVVAGNNYAYRQFLLERLAHSRVPLRIYGSAVMPWRSRALEERYAKRYVVREEKSRIFGEALACLNSTSLAEGNSLNCRAFEVAGAAGLQLIEQKPVLEECFEPGRELLAFGTIDELLGHVERARRFPAEMRVIREAGARRAHAQHTYRQRLEVVLSRLAST